MCLDHCNLAANGPPAMQLLKKKKKKTTRAWKVGKGGGVVGSSVDS